MTDERLDFKIAVLALDRGCIMATTEPGGTYCDGEVRAHHVIYQKHLRNLGLADLLWDPNNGAAVCDRHHRRHHNGREPISEMKLPRRCLDFIAQHDLGRLLDRYYEA